MPQLLEDAIRIKRNLLAAALLLLSSLGAFAADPALPPQAAQAGFTTMLVNQDFSQVALDLGCDGLSQNHFWNQGLWWEKPPAPCNQISIVYEGVAGQKVLDLRWLPSQTNMYDATTIMTMARDYSQYYAYGHGYYEATMRVTPGNISGLWPEFWMWGAKALVYVNTPPFLNLPVLEIDVIEPHGEYPSLVTSGYRGWGVDNGSFIYQDWVSGLDYTQYHKFGVLWTGNVVRGEGGTVCFYLDDVEKGCTSTNASFEGERNFLMLSMGVGCQFQAGNRSCLNVPVTGASDSGSGLVRLSVGSTAGFRTWDTATISGVGGLSSANGVFTLTVVDGKHLDLQGSKFSGIYTSGGTVNALAKADMYVKSVRVWSCAEGAVSGC